MNGKTLDNGARERWRAILRNAGLRCTEQRLHVLHELDLAAAPVPHRDIMDRLGQLVGTRQQHFGTSTIFSKPESLLAWTSATIPGDLNYSEKPRCDRPGTLIFSVLNAERLNVCVSFRSGKQLITFTNLWAEAPSTTYSSTGAASTARRVADREDLAKNADCKA